MTVRDPSRLLQAALRTAARRRGIRTRKTSWRWRRLGSTNEGLQALLKRRVDLQVLAGRRPRVEDISGQVATQDIVPVTAPAKKARATMPKAPRRFIATLRTRI